MTNFLYRDTFLYVYILHFYIEVHVFLYSLYIYIYIHSIESNRKNQLSNFELILALFMLLH